MRCPAVITVVWFATVWFAAVCGASAPAAAAGPPTPPGEADLERGRAVARGDATGLPAGAACHTCHGPDGAGDRSGAFPRIGGQPAWYLYKQLDDYASGARRNAVMEPIARALAARQRQDVAAFYAAQVPAAAAPARSADPALLQRGGSIAAAGLAEKSVAACVNCHGPRGRGLPPTYPYLAGQYAPYVALQFRAWKDGARRNDPLGVMRHIARQLSEDDVRALATYFASLPPPAPAREAVVRP
ncbi:c-type cytochrome [Rhodoplanes sp. TEM]|uniref:C-type cytochrome n=1 Tax=Rhodoplanes tepidamans TaxID=200616 RepID=A0ABT5J607_RHOTP|nr:MULTISPECIES: c-type cytochrome [Rhodoplanes]MDC7785050.1 c-type cytochrome [Rhodoplanes tepidamans]MDC7982524.1 c-type cytochrome [Rhodoplanes sp. TEM]MDQ0356538.1 cytochrome c553 [Rhodoplanes tepidamans]